MKKKFFGIIMSLCLCLLGGVLFAACGENTDSYAINVNFGNKMIYTKTELASKVTHGNSISFDVYGPVYYDYSEFTAYVNGKALKDEFKKEELPTTNIDTAADYVLVGVVTIENVQQDCMIRFSGAKEYQIAYNFYAPDKSIIKASDRTQLSEKQLEIASNFSLRLSSTDAMYFDRDEMTLAELMTATYTDDEEGDLILPDKYEFTYSASELYEVENVEGQNRPVIRYKGLPIMANKSYGYYADDGDMQTIRLFKGLQEANYGQLETTEVIEAIFSLPDQITRETKRTYILDQSTENADGEISTMVNLTNNIMVFPSEQIETTNITMFNNNNVKLWSFVGGFTSLSGLYDVASDTQTTLEVFLDVAEGVNVENLQVMINGKLLAGDLGRFTLVESDSKLSIVLAMGLTPIDFFSDASLSGDYAQLLKDNISSFGFYLTIEGVQFAELSNFTKVKTSNLVVDGVKKSSWTTTGEINSAQTGNLPVDKYKNAYYVDGEYTYYRNDDIATNNKVIATIYRPQYGDKLEELTEHLAYKIGQAETKYVDLMTAVAEGTIVYQTDSLAIVKFVIEGNLTAYARFVSEDEIPEITFGINQLEYLLVEFAPRSTVPELEFSIEMRNQNFSVVDPE